MMTMLSMDGRRAFAGNLFITKEEGLSAQQERLVASFGSRLSGQLRDWSAKFVPPGDAGDLEGPDNIVVALGEDALSEVVKGKGSSPVVAVFINRSSYQEVIKRTRPGSRVTAVYSDPSPKRQIALIKTLLGEGASAGVIQSSGVREDVNESVLAAKELGVRLRVVEIDRHKNPKSVIESLSGVRALLLQKDKEIFETIPLDTMLVLAYDINNLGIIGYSSGVVKNGALATTYTSLEDTVNSFAVLVRKIETSGDIPPPDFSEFYSVSVNKYVMRSLELHERDDDAVKSSIADLLKGGK
ncbi:MAG: hypothetical protein KZQ97_16145 [Candidatus Thiodiazotropha sp. (ex Dulcina madagascariensis)]|nr:hypothetical protein [Candidatus Thiodiazotropha sp. (ex Dulcina madagascariensis)]